MKRTKNVNALDLKALEQLKQGNANAFAEIYERYYPFIYRYAYSFFKTEEDAKDATQDVLIHIYNQLMEDKFKSVGYTLSSWITTVSINFFKSFLRHEKLKRVERNGISLNDNTDSEQFSVIEAALYEVSKLTHYNDNQEMIKDEKFEIMSRLVDKNLTIREQRILTLYFQKVKQKDIAAQMQETHESIRVTVLRIKEKLAKVISQMPSEKKYNYA